MDALRYPCIHRLSKYTLTPIPHLPLKHLTHMPLYKPSFPDKNPAARALKAIFRDTRTTTLGIPGYHETE